jgi:hypothetical protein
MDDLLELDEQVLTVHIPDEVLERAAIAEQSAFTLAFCTSHWDSCALPQ